jgi:hypothetical protein
VALAPLVGKVRHEHQAGRCLRQQVRGSRYRLLHPTADDRIDHAIVEQHYLTLEPLGSEALQLIGCPDLDDRTLYNDRIPLRVVQRAVRIKVQRQGRVAV